MSKLKKQLIRLGHKNPKLRTHLRPVLAEVTKTSSRKVQDYEIERHGIEHHQYFKGVSLDRRFEDKAVGIGDTEYEALEDALENLAAAGWDVDDIPNRLNSRTRVEEQFGDGAYDSEFASRGQHYYVSVQVRGDSTTASNKVASVSVKDLQDEVITLAVEILEGHTTMTASNAEEAIKTAVDLLRQEKIDTYNAFERSSNLAAQVERKVRKASRKTSFRSTPLKELAENLEFYLDFSGALKRERHLLREMGIENDVMRQINRIKDVTRNLHVLKEVNPENPADEDKIYDLVMPMLKALEFASERLIKLTYGVYTGEGRGRGENEIDLLASMIEDFNAQILKKLQRAGIRIARKR